MIQTGKYNTLVAGRRTDNGIYLHPADESQEVLLPNRYIPEDGLEEGAEIEVFVYRDSEDRPVATTERPYATVGEFAFLQVTAVDRRFGAFLDWGLAKDLLVPFNQQEAKMVAGGIYPVYVYLDHVTGRVAASAKLNRFLGNVLPEYNPGDRVKCLVLKHIPDRGYSVIVDNLHQGMIYESEIFEPIEVEQEVDAFVKRVRDDGKIDLTLADSARRRADNVEHKILGALKRNNGQLPFNDKSAPEEIQKNFGCSKKDFKKAIGALYRKRKIEITDEGIKSVQ